MRKTFLSLLCLVMGCCALAGCSDNSQPFEEKSYTPDTQVREIQLDVEDRSIEVALSPDNQVHIQYFENSKEYYQISVSDENVLTMTSASDKAWTDYIGGKPAAEDRRIRLEIPDGLLENVTLSTTNENITLPALTVAKALLVKTSRFFLSSSGVSTVKRYCFACSSFRVEERADLDKPSALCRSAAQTHSPFWESSQHSTIACPSDSSSSLMLCLPCRSREWYSCLNVQSRVASNQNRSFL